MTDRSKCKILGQLPTAVPLVLAGCTGRQSALDPAGQEAAEVHHLFVVMVIGGGFIWLAVIGLLLHSLRGQQRQTWSEEGAGRLIAWGGVAFPVVVLFALLVYAVWLMPSVRPWLARTVPEPTLIEVTGEQFWWRIRYPAEDGVAGFETSNELRLPVGERVAFSLRAADVIHSFWIPSLGGKMDMIPGRTNVLSLLPTRTGVFKAPCAEFCGTSHTYMAFSVVVMEREAYDDWRRKQASGNQPEGSEGEGLFTHHGCAACHSVRGTTPVAGLGPDLTHFAERETVGAGTLANTRENIERFIRDPSAIKPGAQMPAFDMVPQGEIAAISEFLAGLR
ncbi:cytochrome c oxidase subunit II [Rhizobium sp. TRM96647]|uniref:cytochrome c oxidase subunit II n=1 Tax=unclassified Rhizobium TaxID=2613769 RepID=UPI0021E72E1E|nr:MULTISPECIES: cytochrome c oxidase subunit II [unclassified Rhizobium]MCV3739271.1 cytochrome c oxidase subunit II [Rhizobium sp. TRM96647]MCV3760979.1 cytochrome c oxidase subunit II [Rhizobium sp. TRM96650]